MTDNLPCKPFSDVNERKKAEELLKKNEEQMKAIISNAPIGIATSDSNKFFLSANKSFCRILGFSEDELRKLTFKEITHPDDIDTVRQKWKNSFLGKFPFSVRRNVILEKTEQSLMEKSRSV